MRTAKRGSKRNQKAQGSSAWKLLGPALLLVFTFLIYANSLGNGFVFDDQTLILQNPRVSGLEWSQILTGHAYRPLRTLTYAVNYALGGAHPFGYHLFNLFLHAANILLLFFLFKRWTSSTRIGLVGALIFAAHPAQTAAVAYISGRKDLLAVFFLLLGLHSFTRYREKARPDLLAGTVACFALGMLSKETAIVFPALLLLLDVLILQVKDGPQRQGVPGRIGSYFRHLPWLNGIFLGLVALAVYYAVEITHASRKVGLWGGSLSNHVGTCFKLFAHYIRLALFPHPLIADYTGNVFPISKGLAEPSTLFSILIAAAFIAVAIWAAWRRPALSFGMSWFLVSLLPVLQIVPFHEIAADHFLYLPLVGVSFIAGWAFDFWLREQGWEILAWGVTGLIILAFSGVVISRNRDWKSAQTLWEATMKTAPGSFRANTNLGQIYFRQGRVEEGIRFTRRSTELDPRRSESWSNLGGQYYTLARQSFRQGSPKQAELLLQQAMQYLEKAVRLSPGDGTPLGNLGNCFKLKGLILEKEGRTGSALKARQEAVSLYFRALKESEGGNPALRALWLNIGNVCMDAGLCDQAVDYYRTYFREFPASRLGNYEMGYCLFQLKRFKEAVPYLEKACRYQPDLENWSLLAHSYEGLAENQKAIDTYLRAIRFYPASVEAHFNLGVLYERVGDWTASERSFQRALELAPNGPLAPDIKRKLEYVRSLGSHS